ncbi:hypothetical protein GC098_27025 [Paenibacillus sp. LMG 31458]|uniref:Bacterial Ig-like domain-containing protein n=1 Tax=Paenibacillus phytorum TaxID=2654977 RepID=A0ABX1Y2A1_9BACL|nr:Ig-like domain-containing protein [Paenibacillus phytorum]NOU74995.1 hypothetical protein [Paenibacillus phytorum]
MFDQMLKQKILKRALNSVFLYSLSFVISFILLAVIPATTVRAAPGDDLGILDIKVNKPVNAVVDLHQSTIQISLPYGTLYQMLNITTNPGANATLYRSNGTTAISFASSGINKGDAKIDQLSASGTTLYYLAVTDKMNSSASRKYTVKVTVEKAFPANMGPVGPNDRYLPLNIRAGEYAWDVMGTSKIGNGSTTGSIEGPGTPSSYSGKQWSESVYDRSGDYPVAGTVNESWLGDNMYLQTIGKSNANALTKYGIVNVPGTDKLSSDILRYHEFLPFVTSNGVSRDDGDRGAVNSDRQRLEIKSNTGASNIDANSVGGDIMTHHWRLMLPSETLRYQKDVGDKHAGDFIVPHRFWHIFQLKEVAGNAAGQPVTTLSLVSSDGKGQLEFRNNPDGQYADRIKPLFTIPFDKVVDRWLDYEVTILTADKGYLYGKLTDLETGDVLFQGGMTAETYRRPEVENPVTGRLERGDLPVQPGQQNRSKWGLYRGLYNGEGDAAYADEFQSATMYLADVSLIKRDEDSYIFPDDWDPSAQPKDVVAWDRLKQITVSKGTALGSLGLPSQLDVTLTTGKTEKMNVTWSTTDYTPDRLGLYTIYGELDGPGITNTKNIKPYVEVTVTAPFTLFPGSTASYTVNPGGPSIGTAAGGSTSTGNYLQTSSAPKVGDWVELNIDVTEAANYDIQYGYMASNNRGIAQLYIDGVPQGYPVDEYNPAQKVSAADMGNMALDAGSHKFRFVVIGKNAASSNYHLTFDHIKLVQRDAAQPMTEAQIAPAPRNGWLNTDASITLSVYDDLSGVARTEYRLKDQMEWIAYTRPIDFKHEGESRLQFRSVDVAGNIEPTKEVTIRIDKTNPTYVLTANGEPLVEGTIFSDDRPIALLLNANDAQSGIASQELVLDGKRLENGAALNLAGKLGLHTLHIVITDLAGNATDDFIRFTTAVIPEGLSNLIDGYATAGELTNPLVNQLRNSLDQALHQLDKGDKYKAAKHMQDFLKHLDNEPMAGYVSDSAKSVLTADANALIAAWLAK